MKKLLFFVAALFVATVSYAQEIPPAPADKAVVYFARTTSFGALINFSYFDSTTFIGKRSGPNYIRYECAPGKHLFWARSENKDFIEADLEAGKIYLIQVDVAMGGIKAQVGLTPIDKKDPDRLKKVLKLLSKKQPEVITAQERAKDGEAMKDVIERGMAKYADDKKHGVAFTQLTKEMFY